MSNIKLATFPGLLEKTAGNISYAKDIMRTLAFITRDIDILTIKLSNPMSKTDRQILLNKISILSSNRQDLINTLKSTVSYLKTIDPEKKNQLWKEITIFLGEEV